MIIKVIIVHPRIQFVHWMTSDMRAVFNKVIPLEGDLRISEGESSIAYLSARESITPN